MATLHKLYGSSKVLVGVLVFFFFLSFILVKSVCGCRAQLFIVKALAILIKMEYYFKLFTIEVEENEGGRIRGKLDMF